MSKKKAAAILIASLLVTNGLTFVLTNYASLVLGEKALVSKQEYKDIQDYKKLFDVRDIIKSEYVDKVDDHKLIEGAVRGLAEGVGDPYTVYWDPEEYQSNSIQTEGEYAGLGLVVGQKDDSVVVISPMEDSPAEKAGIKSGDIIVKVDDKDVAGDLDLAVSMMRGKTGTNVKLTLLKKNASAAVDVNVVRANIVMKSVKGEMLENSIGYIRITAFQNNTAEDFKKALTNLQSAGMKGFVLDLRDNGGGLLDQCIKVADELIGEGTIVYTIDNKNNKEVATSDANSVNVPMAVLVNGGTASASEIVSGAIKDTKSGKLVGTKTFGKGLVQTIEPIPADNSAVKVTIARYYTPSGVCIQGTGIQPDLIVGLPDELKQKTDLTRSEDIQLSKAIEVVKGQM